MSMDAFSARLRIACEEAQRCWPADRVAHLHGSFVDVADKTAAAAEAILTAGGLQLSY